MKYIDDYYYLIQLQYLGFRFHGWQKQPDVKTVQEYLEKTLRFIFNHQNFKTLGGSRTDAMVSANDAYCHVTTKEFYDTKWLTNELNKNLPRDINIINIKQVNASFDMIGAVKLKEYHYLFSHGERNHPFAAPMMVGKTNTLDIDLMQQGAKLFEGKHNFKKYTKKTSKKTIFEREVFSSEIIKNNLYTANFFPKESYIYKVTGPGFMHYQIRMMMGSLFLLGSGKMDLKTLEKTLSDWNDELVLKEIAPASGLILHKNILK
ncbi:tRNA pseudouridine synthase A [Wenyingzhuangia marina]|uniref:tRNA pseudouridine synthase A n=1 Tax=Wenyingzhuangia marina TaxID=1195760 RepID=A0A1M5T7X3_9FLAO|nr:tRNA pseudouridine(38-40) synthase TruA [Wenyingzhuangia marina]GGF65728.1 tRNA pseudouridine synthase A [Wenyingzhuangia marina]SHH46796.1 tRNA pseudouridine38-40 synthase [Wenyingzhuangia marina]